MGKSQKIEILDTTLREGEQCFGVLFPIEIKKQIALLLNRIGVDFIEAGHPAAAPSIEQAVSAIAALHLKSTLIAHARLDRNEIQLVKDLGLNWVGLFCGINEHARRKYGLSRREIFRKATDAVHFAKRLGLSVKFACEDASRTDPEELSRFCRHLASINVDRLSFADTLGVLTPGGVRQACLLIKKEFPLSMLHFHLHDDSGLAVENAAAAMDHQAGCIDVSIMGIGERLGIVPLEKALAVSRDRGRIDESDYYEKLMLLRNAASLVESCINPEHYSMRRFAHKSGIHINGVLKDKATYETVDPSTAGEQRILVLSKMIGKSGLQKLLQYHGFQADREVVDSVAARVKADNLLELFQPDEIKKYFTQNGVRECRSN